MHRDGRSGPPAAPAHDPWSRAIIHAFWKILLLALGGYVAVTALAFLFQRKMLYLPSTDRLPEDRALAAGLTRWPAPEEFRGFVAREPAAAEGTVVVFHGNAGAAHDRSFYATALAKHGWRVILAEYPGYGGRDGSPGEDALVSDAVETIRLAQRAYGEPLYLWGESLGCGVVAGAVRDTDIPIAGVVLLLPWDSLPRVAQTHYWFLPARWLVRDQYDNIDNLRGYAGNVAVLLAEHDEVVPSRHGMRLYESLATRKRLWVFEDAGHNEIPVAPDLPWWGEVVAFVAR